MTPLQVLRKSTELIEALREFPLTAFHTITITRGRHGLSATIVLLSDQVDIRVADPEIRITLKDPNKPVGVASWFTDTMSGAASFVFDGQGTTISATDGTTNKAAANHLFRQVVNVAERLRARISRVDVL